MDSVRRRHPLAYCPCIHPVRNRGKSLGIAISSVIVDYTVVCPVRFKDGQVASTRIAWLLNRRVSDDCLGVSALRIICVESSRVRYNCSKNHTELGITGNDTKEATAITMACSKNSSGVDAKLALDVEDQLFDERPVILHICLPRAVSGVRFKACWIANALDVDRNGIWVKRSIIEPGLRLYGLRSGLIAVESEDHWRRLVYVVMLRNVYKITPLVAIGWCERELHASSIGDKPTWQWQTAASTCGCHWSCVIRIGRNVSNDARKSGPRRRS